MISYQDDSYRFYGKFYDIFYFRNKDKLIKFANDDLKNYELFKKILLNFQKVYNIEEFNLKDLDRYLW